MDDRRRELGEFCWFNILTPEPAAARAFFADLLGWSYRDMGLGHTVQVAGHDVGGLFDLAGPRTPPGTAPLVGLMVKVASADATAEAVNRLGGKARPPFDIGGAGRLSVCQDPSGAGFDTWEPRGLQGWDLDPARAGAPTWFQATSAEPDRAAEFYAALFGWTAGPARSGCRTFSRGHQPVGAVREGAERFSWATYFAVNDLDVATRRAAGLGAEVSAAPAASIGGPCARVRSPQGVPFCLMQRGPQ